MVQLSRNQKHVLARELIRNAADMIENWDNEAGELNDQGVTAQEAAEQFAVWLAHLPGDGWDMRLPQPQDVR